MPTLNYPVALLTPEFMSTGISIENELSDHLVYCFDNYEIGDWRLFDCDGFEYNVRMERSEKTSVISRVFTGRREKHHFSFFNTVQLTKEEISEIFLRHLFQHRSWWWNNEESISSDRLHAVISQSSTMKELFGNLGWFAPEVY